MFVLFDSFSINPYTTWSKWRMFLYKRIKKYCCFNGICLREQRGEQRGRYPLFPLFSYSNDRIASLPLVFIKGDATLCLCYLTLFRLTHTPHGANGACSFTNESKNIAALMAFVSLPTSPCLFSCKDNFLMIKVNSSSAQSKL